MLFKKKIRKLLALLLFIGFMLKMASVIYRTVKYEVIIRMINEKISLSRQNFKDLTYRAPKYQMHQKPLAIEGFFYDFWYENSFLPYEISNIDQNEFMKLIEKITSILVSNRIEYTMVGQGLLNSWNKWGVLPEDSKTVSSFS